MGPFSRRIVCGAVIALFATALAAADTQTMNVQVRQTAVRSTPSFLGKIVATVAYGDQLAVVTVQNDWAQVNLPSGGQGWLPASALTKQQLALQSGSNVQQNASNNEVALAGKGFNEQVEAQYQSQTDLDYTWVDKMEKIAYTPDQLIAFLKQGDLGAGAGAQ